VTRGTKVSEAGALPTVTSLRQTTNGLRECQRPGQGGPAERGAATTPLAASRAPAAGRGQAVAAAFVLGWRLAELDDRDLLPRPPAAAGADIAAPEHLPGASEMTDHERACVLLAQARDALTILDAGLRI
jgi:hypothetical protein